MPLYTFQHPKTKEVIEVNQSMTDKHVYTDEKGVEWNRVWDTSYQVGVITRELIQGIRKVSNVNGKSIPVLKCKMLIETLNIKLHNQLPGQPSLLQHKKTSKNA